MQSASEGDFSNHEGSKITTPDPGLTDLEEVRKIPADLRIVRLFLEEYRPYPSEVFLRGVRADGRKVCLTSCWKDSKECRALVDFVAEFNAASTPSLWMPDVGTWCTPKEVQYEDLADSVSHAPEADIPPAHRRFIRLSLEESGGPSEFMISRLSLRGTRADGSLEHLASFEKRDQKTCELFESIASNFNAKLHPLLFKIFGRGL